MTRTYVDIHVLQTVPPSNLNRDDTGSPKTAFYGGVRRARVSSQAWKRAVRTAFDDVLDRDQLGVRTRRVVELVADAIRVQDPTVAETSAWSLAEAVLTKAGIKLKEPKVKKGDAVPAKESGYLLFLSRAQARALADAALTRADAPAKEIKALADLDHSVDLALFGRMVADDTGLNVDASVQVAHAISVHPVETEFDYFTAVDDHKSADEAEEDAGAGMIGTVEFNSSTLYRYATVDVTGLVQNLGAEAVPAAVEAFLGCFVTSMPTGKQNTFANRTLPDAVWVHVRDDQPINLVGAYEEAIEARTGRVGLAVTALADHAASLAGAYGVAPVASWAAGPKAQPLGDVRPWPEVVQSVGALIAERTAAVPAPA